MGLSERVMTGDQIDPIRSLRVRPFGTQDAGVGTERLAYKMAQRQNIARRVAIPIVRDLREGASLSALLSQ